MHFSSLAFALCIALPSVHSIPAPSQSSSEVEFASTHLNAPRALPSGDSYPPQPPGAGSGKRGLLYSPKSKVEWSDLYVGSAHVTYGSNGDVIRGSQLDSRFSYVPTIAVDAKLKNVQWNSIVPVLIEGGTKALFASNEPDSSSGANLTPSQSVTVYKKYLQPFYGTVQLGTPAVTNGGGQAGLTYLDNFLHLCTGCAFNFVNVHFLVNRSEMTVSEYVQALKDYVDINVPAIQKKHQSVLGLPIVIGEFWLTGASDDEAGELMDEILPWFDANDKILFYQASGGLFKEEFVNAAGTGLTPAGTAYGKLAP